MNKQVWICDVFPNAWFSLNRRLHANFFAWSIFPFAFFKEVIPRCIIVFPYKVQNQITTPNDPSVISYNYLNLSKYLYTTSRVGKNEWRLFTKLSSCYCRYFMIYNTTPTVRCRGLTLHYSTCIKMCKWVVFSEKFALTLSWQISLLYRNKPLICSEKIITRQSCHFLSFTY